MCVDIYILEKNKKQIKNRIRITGWHGNDKHASEKVKVHGTTTSVWGGGGGVLESQLWACPIQETH